VAEPEDFETFYLASRARLVASLSVLLGDVELASDAADEAFERALTRWSRVSQMESPPGWTYRVALNVARRQARRRTIESRLLARRPTATPLPAQVVEVREILDQLAPHQRAAMTLRVLGDLTENDIASVLGVSRSTVRSALADARRNLSPVVADAMEREQQ
jgi:RNA polymerase sigma-70 factor (ECF subfamily)